MRLCKKYVRKFIGEKGRAKRCIYQNKKGHIKGCSEMKWWKGGRLLQ